ncbi:MAG: ATP-binding protein [Armatimonadetes bacterium]|nr:ATP-binding protein [Armatimonadota bacterium]
MDAEQFDGETEKASGVYCESASSLKPDIRARRDVLEFEVPSSPEMLYDIRSRVALFAGTMPFSHDDIEDIRLAVGEAGANALRHGVSPTCCKVGVRAERRRDSIRILVIDKGCGFNPNALVAPGLDNLNETGRGIMFMRLLMDEVKFHTGGLGTSVELVKRFRRLS